MYGSWLYQMCNYAESSAKISLCQLRLAQADLSNLSRYFDKVHFPRCLICFIITGKNTKQANKVHYHDIKCPFGCLYDKYRTSAVSVYIYLGHVSSRPLDYRPEQNESQYDTHTQTHTHTNTYVLILSTGLIHQ